MPRNRIQKKKLNPGRYADQPSGQLDVDSLGALLYRSRRRSVRRPEDYLALGAVHAAVHRLVTTFAYLDRSVVRFHEGRRETVEDHPVTYLLQHPNSELSGFEFWRTTGYRYLARPGSFVEIVWNQGEDAIVELCLPEDRKVKPDRIDDRLVYKVEGGEVLEPHEVLHFRGLSLDGITGSSPFEVASRELDLGMNAVEFGKNFFERGGHPSGYYTAPGKLNAKLLEQLKEQHLEDVAGLDNVGRTLMFGDGVEWRPFTSDPEKSQLVGVRSAAVEDAARLLGFPLSMLNGDPSDSAKAEFVECLRLHLEVFEAELTYKLLTPTERAMGYCIEHDLSVLRRSDPSAKVDDLTKGFGFGAVTINEWRAGCGLEPLAVGGDMRLVATNNLDSVKNVEDVQTLDAPKEPEALEEEPKAIEGPKVEATNPAIRAVFADQIARVVRRGRKALGNATTSQAVAKVYSAEDRHARDVLPAYAALVGADLEAVIAAVKEGMESPEDESNSVDRIVDKFYGGVNG